MKKGLALDLDGTVLNPAGLLTEEVRQALIKADEKNVQLIFCSGRPFSGVLPILKAVGLPDTAYAVTNNGSRIESASGNILYEKVLNLQDYQRVSDFCSQYRLSLIAIGKEHTYCHQSDFHEGVDRFCSLTGQELTIQPIWTHPSGRIFFKFMVCSEPEKITTYKTLLTEQFNACYQCVQSEAGYLEILPGEVSKGNALKQVAEFYQLKPADIFAVGDNENDLSMLRYSGTAIGMKNGTDAVKEMADWICPSNEENGIVKVVDWVLKKI